MKKMKAMGASFCLAPLLAFTGCETTTEPQTNPAVSPAAQAAGSNPSATPYGNTVVLNNPNRHLLGQPEAEALAKTMGASWGTDHDASGKIQIQIWECTGSVPTGALQVTCDVDTTAGQQVLIGGGAYADYAYGGAGALLTASYPGYNLATWYAKAKDHGIACAYTLHTYAIGMRFLNIDRRAMLPYMKLSQATSTASHAPTVSVTVPSTYTMLSGGASANYTGYGQMLTASYPMPNSNLSTWIASSKDQKYSDVTQVTAFALSVQTNTPFGVIFHDYDYASSPLGYGAQTAAVARKSGYVVSGYGALSNYSSNGRLLWRMSPALGSMTTEIAGDKDHLFSDYGGVTAYLMEIQAE